ncbi:MAG: alpha/beta hydrolase [Byssovorax sp.]
MNSELSLLHRAVAAAERVLLAQTLHRPRLVALLARRRAPIGSRTLDPQTAALLVLSNVDPGVDVTRHPPAEARRKLIAELSVVDERPPPGVRAVDAHAEGPAGPIPLRVYTPPDAGERGPAVVFFHGGGWVTGDLDTHDSFCRRLAHGTGFRVVAVHYRRAPESPFPAALDDATAAFRWVARSAAKLGIDPSRIALAGDSAGGNLTAAVAKRARRDEVRPALQVILYGSADATCSSPSHKEMGEGHFLSSRSIEWYLNHYLGSTDRKNPEVSPIFDPDLEGVAPALVYTAGFDPLRDDGLHYAEKLRSFGVKADYEEFPGLVHGFILMTGVLDEARRATNRIIHDIRRALG